MEQMLSIHLNSHDEISVTRRDGRDSHRVTIRDEAGGLPFTVTGPARELRRLAAAIATHLLACDEDACRQVDRRDIYGAVPCPNCGAGMAHLRGDTVSDHLRCFACSNAEKLGVVPAEAVVDVDDLIAAATETGDYAGLRG